MSAEVVVLKVRADSDCKKLGISIALSLDEGKEVYLRSVGAGATNQSIKASAIANGWLGTKGSRLALVPGFANVEGRDGGTISAISLKVIPLT